MDSELINPEVLISLVEERITLWDKTSDLYKDKTKKFAHFTQFTHQQLESSNRKPLY